MGIALLGPLSVDGLPAPTAPRDRMVLGALALRLGEVVSAERLADALWGERPPTSWNKVVQGCVVRLRKLLGPGAIETLPQGYRLVLRDTRSTRVSSSGCSGGRANCSRWGSRSAPPT